MKSVMKTRDGERLAPLNWDDDDDEPRVTTTELCSLPVPGEDWRLQSHERFSKFSLCPVTYAACTNSSSFLRRCVGLQEGMSFLILQRSLQLWFVVLYTWPDLLCARRVFVISGDYWILLRKYCHLSLFYG